MRLAELPGNEPDVLGAVERDRLAHGRPPGRPRLGEILLAAGEISQRDLNEALERKHHTGRRIGEELVAAGAVTAERLRQAIRLQRRLMLTALLAAVMGQAHAGDARAIMSITANIVDSVGIRAVYQAQSLEITREDVQRGYVEVPAGSRFEIRSRGPCLFEFRGMGEVFRSVTVTAGGSAVEFGAAGGTLLQKLAHDAGTAVALSYRFALNAGVRPGTHQWPITVTVLPL